MTEDIRWKQRFSNFEKAYDVFMRVCNIKDPSEAEKMGIIQSFEVVFELSWKVLQDYLKARGYDIAGPKPVLRQAFKDGIVDDGHAWLKALDNRNETVHTYDETKAEEIVSNVKSEYVQVVTALYNKLKGEV